MWQEAMGQSKQADKVYQLEITAPEEQNFGRVR